jgi:hypothetical protein
MAAEDAPVGVRRSLVPKCREVAWETGAEGESSIKMDAGSNRATVEATPKKNMWPLSWWVVGLPAAAPTSGRWRYEVDLNLKRIKAARLFYAPGEGAPVGCNSWDITEKMAADQGLYEVKLDHKAACLTSLSVGWSVLGATLPSFDDEEDYPWKFPTLGVLGAKEGRASCGLWRRDGHWRTTAADTAAQTDTGGGGMPLKDGTVVVGLLLDADTNEMHVSVGVGKQWVMVQQASKTPSGLGGPLFPAVCCMGHLGTVRFNFGERPWQCDAPTPGEQPWEGIGAAAEGDTPLRASLEGGHEDTALLLLRRTADDELDAADDHGETLAHLAVKKGCARLLRALGEKGANLSAKDNDGLMPAHVAAKNGHIDVLLEQAFGVEVNCRNKRGTTPLHLAAEAGNTSTVQALMSAGADVNCQNKEGPRPGTPLHWAARHGHTASVEILLANTADVNSMNKFGVTVRIHTP